MGFNTVAVLYNDCRLAGDATLGDRIDRAMHEYTWPGRRDIGRGMNFGKGMVVSMAHADYTQIVAVGQNRGRAIQDCNDLDYVTLSSMAECLIRHGWNAKPPAKKRKART